MDVMRVPLILVAAIGFVLGSAGVSTAEKVKTNQSTKIFARPGEQAKVLMTAKSGTAMQLISQDGRWLKIRLKGRTGYVPRSKVDMADSGGISRNTRRRPFVDGRGKNRGFGGESAPDDRIGADALGEGADEPAGDGGDDEEDEPAPKKAAATKPAPKPAAKKPVEDDDEEEEEDEPPAKKPATPAAKKVTTKPAAQDEDDEEEEDEETPAKKPATPAKKVTPSKPADDEEEEEDEESDDEPASKAASKGDDEEDPVGGKTEEEEAPRATARVTKNANVYEDPDPESTDVFVVRPTDVLYPIENKGEWTFVENAEGDGGWIQSDFLVMGDGGASGGKRMIDVRVRGGLTIIQQGMRTAGSNVLEVPDNYNIGTSSMTLSLGAGILVPKGAKYLVGGEFTYDYAKTLGGGVFYDPDGPGGMAGANIGITLSNVNVRGMAGIDLKKRSGMSLLGRLGYRYQGFLINDVANFTANPAKLPSEVVKGPTLGAGLAIPRLTDKIGIRFSLDTMLFAASVKQTKGLEDGATPSAKAVVVGAGLMYRLSKSFELMAEYDLNYMGIDFGAPVTTSMRNHMGTNVKRTDIFHMLTFGIAKPF
jgi:hypothetical protein